MSEKTNGSALALVKEQPTAALAVSGSIRIGSVGEVFELAGQLAKARGFVPKHLLGDTGSIAAALLTGIELGIGPMEALRSIHVVEGRPTMSADLMLARAIRAGVVVQWLETSATRARCRLTRPGFAPYEQSWTKEDAEKAGLWGRNTWAKYPAAMLRARCIAAAIRAYAPDVLGAGLYTADEVTSGEVLDAHAEVEIVDPSTGEVHPAPAAAPESLRDCATLEQLRAFVAKQSGPLRKSSTGRKKVSDRLHELMDGAPPHEIEAALCMLEDAAAIKLERRQPPAEVKREPQTADSVGLGYDDMSDADQALYDAVHADIGDK